MIRKLALLAVPFVLAGCAQAYIYEGKRYDSAEAMFMAGNTAHTDALRQITPLPQALTSKKLIVAIPSEKAFYDAGYAYATKIDGRVPTGPNLETFTNLVKFNHGAIKNLYDAIERRRIYSSTSYREMGSTVVNLEPSADTDVMYVTSPDPTSAQWFYASQKYGKQVFAFDRSVPGPTGKTNAFLEAVQAQAIRE